VNSFRIRGIGLLILLMMAVRVSITPGVRHRHEHGHHPHSHHHPHAHGSHPHSHQHPETKPAEAYAQTGHVHVFLFGWEFTFSSPFPDEETTPPPPTAVSDALPQADALPWGPVLTSPAGWGTLIQWVFDLRSPQPPAKLALPQGVFSDSLVFCEKWLSSRDRDKPLLPPPEPGPAMEAAC
jgi:hypothetical protein